MAEQEMRTELNGLKTSVDELRVGHERLSAGLDEVRTGLAEVRTGLDEVRTGLKEVRTDLDELRTSVAELHVGHTELRLATAASIEELGRQMRVLHEDTIERIKALAPDFRPIRREFRAADAALFDEIDRRLTPLEAAERRRRRPRRS